MKRSLLLSLLAAFCSPLAGRAQDIHFSQFYEAAMLRNPALTGIFSGDYKVGLNYRSQWNSISAPFQTILGSGEMRLPVNDETGDCFSFGMTTTYDRAGTINFSSLQVMPVVAYNKAMGDDHGTYLSAGFSGGYVQRSVDATRMTFDNQYVSGAGYDPAAASGETMSFQTLRHWDVSAGLSLNSSLGEYNRTNYYLGVAAFHLTQPKQAFNGADEFTRLQTKWTGNAGMRWSDAQDRIGVTSHFNYVRQATFQEIIGGAMVSYHNFNAADARQNFTVHAGAFYRYKDAVIPTVKLDWQRYSLTMSYDVNNSSLKNASSGRGGWEISLFARGARKRTENPMACPRFELAPPAYAD